MWPHGGSGNEDRSASKVCHLRRQRRQTISKLNFKEATGLGRDDPSRSTLSWEFLCSDHPAWLFWSWGLWAHQAGLPRACQVYTWPLFPPRFLPWCIYLMAICSIPTKQDQFPCGGSRSEPDRLLQTVHYAVLRSIRKDHMCVNNHVFISQ